MPFVQRGFLGLAIAVGCLGFAGCADDNAAGVPAGTKPANAPKDSMEAFKQQGNMAPQGAPSPGKKAGTPKPAPHK